MWFAFLGPLEVRDGPRVIDVPRPKVRALLALLLLSAGRVVGTERLVDQLWCERPPARPVATVHNYVSILRRLLEPPAAAGLPSLLVTQASGYVLRVPPEHIDAGVFEQLAATARSALSEERWAEAARSAEQALSLWRGPALADFRYEEFAAAPARRLEEARHALEEDRICARLALGEHAQLVGELEAAVRHEPLRESLWGHLMVALYRSGRQADALAAYRTVRRRLDEEFGLEPGPDLQRLEEAVLLQKAELDWIEPRVQPPARVQAPAAKLPQLPAGFVGRARELAGVTRLLRDPSVRLLTLAGPGGAGKTRLALQVATAVGPEFPDGVCFVPLASVQDPQLVVPAVARALGVKEVGGESPLETVTRHVAGRRMLLLLDNFEHLRPAAGAVAELVSAGQDATVLVTSRAVLRVYGEHEYRLGPLSLPDPCQYDDLAAVERSDAVALFVQRARAVLPGFALSRDNVAAVAGICARLDGLPLAVELAAARVRLLSPQELADRLEQRLPLLTSGAVNVPARQRTLRDTIEWSYRLLDAGERALFRRLSVFVGGWTLDAAEAVCGGDVDVLSTMGSLVADSLVWRDEAAQELSRLSMLQTIREYACEQLEATGEAAEHRRRHAGYYLEVACGGASEPSDPDELVMAGFAACDREHDNITAALEWFLSSPPSPEVAAAGLRLVGGMGWYWYTRGRDSVAAGYLERALARAPDAPATLRAKPCYWLGAFLDRRGDFARAREWMEASAALSRTTGDTKTLAGALNGLATVAENGGDQVAARASYEESLVLYREVRDRGGMATALFGLGALAIQTGDMGRAGGLLAESLALFEDVGDRWGIAVSRGALARVAIEQGDLDRAEGLLRQATRSLGNRGEVGHLTECLERYAFLAAARGHADRAARLLGAADALDASIGAVVPPHRRAARARHLESLRAGDPQGFDAARAEGARMTLEEALDYATGTSA